MTLKGKTIEDILGKGENARKLHFLLFPSFLPNQEEKSRSMVVPAKTID